MSRMRKIRAEIFMLFRHSTYYIRVYHTRELLKCIVAAMYSWQHCGTGTLSYRQPRHHFSNHGSVERSTTCYGHKNVLQKQW